MARRLAIAAAMALYFPASLVLYLARIRFLRLVAPNRIGHLTGDVATYVKMRLMGMRVPRRVVFISPPGVAANECLLDYWQRYICVVRSKLWAKLLGPFRRFPYLVHDTGILALDETAPYIAVERQWGERPALLELTAEHRRRGEAWLASVGVPAGARFICFHSREAGYSPGDENLHSFRNSSIENYLPAAAALVERGFWCLRMGDPTMRPIAAGPRIIDYARHPGRSDWLDVFLCASCRFFIGSASGLVNLANLFGRPGATANQAPLSTVLAFGVADLAIPRLLWSEAERRHLRFAEILASPAGNFRFTELYREHGLVPQENSAEDIRDLALEMLERIEGRVLYTAEDEARQRRFAGLLRPGHFSYGGVNRVGRDFLRKYAHLLEDGPTPTR